MYTGGRTDSPAGGGGCQPTGMLEEREGRAGENAQ